MLGSLADDVDWISMSYTMRTLLIVDDFEPDRELYRRYLLADSSSTYQLLEADCATAGLELCRTQQIDAIVLDYWLPDIDGLAFMDRLDAQSNGGETPPVVIVTGRGDERVAVQAMKRGAQDYLMKHCLTPELLKLTVQTVIENARLRRQLRQSEDTQRESEHCWREIFNTCFHFMGLLAIDGIVLEVNQAALDSVGAYRCDIVGQYFWETPWWNHSQQLQSQLKAAIAAAANGEFIRYEMNFPNAMGGTTTMDFSLKPVCDQFGQVLRLIAEGRDISDRKLAEQRLRELQERLQLGIQVAVGLAQIDYASSTVALSPEAAALYGLPADSLVVSRDRIHATFHPDERSELFGIIEQVLDPAGIGWFAREHRVVWHNGEIRWLYVRKQVFFDRSSDDPRPSYAILAAIDISDRKLAEAERERLLSLAEAANRGKDEFVAMVAHELRSPLNSIFAWAKLLQNRKLDEETTAKALATISRNTQVQVQLVEDLLDISRMVTGTLHLTLAPVNLVEVIEGGLDMVRPMATAKKIQLDTHLTVTPQISGDWQRLQQILVNLLTNAIKFTPERGRVEIALFQVDSQVQLRIHDNGKGIAKEFLPVIFERFKQGQNNTGSQDGLGLGLAIVKHLVELHSGTITAHSQGEGQGATFTIRLPLLKFMGDE
ncbi:MAG: PAS domain S-box protein [Stigonema ocellatum SAG 48.90 = DSM 106950]|nr:PAS domain S-box protein [Stigonema ocellatum SAG 48.90 = DSM 106950]